LKHSLSGLKLAHEIDHSFTLADVLRYGSCELRKMMRDGQPLKTSAEELIHLSEEKNFPAWMATGKTCRGEGLILLGQLEEGMSLIRGGVKDELSVGVRCSIPGSLLYLAEGYARQSDPEQGLSVLAEAFEMMDQTGERHWETEILRMQAALYRMQGRDEEAEASLKKALELARERNARLWELRAALDLAHLWQDQGKAEEGQQMVKEIYSWFTEGFDTPDLREARELIGDLLEN
jgi:predicted ATPase